MQKHLELTRQRLKNFTSETNLGGKIYTASKPVKLSAYHAPDRIDYQTAISGEFKPVEIGYQFAPPWSTHWVRVEIEVPMEWTGKEIHLLWDSTSEACVWDKGVPLQGLTGSRSNSGNQAIRKEFILTRNASGGERYLLYIEVACNGLFGVRHDAGPWSQLGLLRQAEIAIFDRAAWDLYWDFTIISDMAQYLPANTPRGGQALYTANLMVNTIDIHDRSTWEKARVIAKKFFLAKNGDGQHHLSAIGHAHIDTAWLWPLAETKRKCVRTFSTAVRYMDDYPNYKFACSQAQQYEWMKQNQPELYKKIKEKVQTGQFIPAGGTWVEPDCNIPSGESLVRQFLFGQRFFKKEFGSYCTEFWEPDVFGYSAALPQIMKLAGIENFLTIKLSWSQFNKLSSHTFWWEGIDGSRVFTHFPPADTYNSMANVKEVLFNVQNFKDHDRANESYMLFGYGDGGGGPTMAMLEQINRMSDVDGLPKVEMRSPAEFFQRCRQDAKDLTRWVGELYLELHRGTYTTQARNKYYNRRSEFLLHDIEFLSLIAFIEKSNLYPADDISDLWKIVLTNQFHDIIPGSSIREVYQDSDQHYQQVLTTGERIAAKAVKELVGEPGENVYVINTLGTHRKEVVEVNNKLAVGQPSVNGGTWMVVSAPAYGISIQPPQSDIKQGVTIQKTEDRYIFENEWLKCVVSTTGEVMSLFDKRIGRECVSPGTPANHYVLFDDEPNNWDAWDVDVFHLEKRYEVNGASSSRILEKGPIRAAVEFTYQVGRSSSLVLVISMSAVSARLDFNLEVDWRENHKFLKVEFPLDIRSTFATYEIQFGHIQRPNHFNTSWDMARFEVCGQKWADLSESGFGVALINDCKYGHAAYDNVLRLSLLRSPNNPDPEADKGIHTIQYALFPHAGTFQEGGVIEEALAFNNPLRVGFSHLQPQERSYFSVDQAGVVIDTVKKAEDSDDIILRLYESYGAHVSAVLKTAFSVKCAFACNLLEEGDLPLEVKDGKVEINFKPFEIKTIKLKISQ